MRGKIVSLRRSTDSPSRDINLPRLHKCRPIAREERNSCMYTGRPTKRQGNGRVHPTTFYGTPVRKIAMCPPLSVPVCVCVQTGGMSEQMPKPSEKQERTPIRAIDLQYRRVGMCEYVHRLLYTTKKKDRLFF